MMFCMVMPPSETGDGSLFHVDSIIMIAGSDCLLKKCVLRLCNRNVYLIVKNRDVSLS